jgi:hypothetical protein
MKIFQWHFITYIKKWTLKFIWKHKIPWIAKAILSKKSNSEGTTMLVFKIYYRAIAIKIAWYWHEKYIWRPVEPNRRPRYETMQLWSPDFWQSHQKHTMFLRKDRFFNKCFWDNWISACRKLKLNPCPSPCTKINSKWIKGLHMIYGLHTLIWNRTKKLLTIS